MTTSTNAEEVFKQQLEWLRTSGGAVPWIFASSNVSFVPMPSVGTVAMGTVALDWFSVVPRFERLTPLDLESVEEETPLALFRVDPLQHAVLNLLTYSPKPDQPNDQDVGPELGYGLPL